MFEKPTEAFAWEHQALRRALVELTKHDDLARNARDLPGLRPWSRYGHDTTIDQIVQKDSQWH